MNWILRMTAILAATTAATPAFAQADKAFDGPWIGATAGYDNFSGDAEAESSTEDGIVYGVALGYDVNLNGFVLGVEAELTGSSIEASAVDLIEDGDTFTLDAGRDLYAGVRVGRMIGEKAMIYAKGGYTNQRFSTTYTLDDEIEEASGNSDGWRLGAGVEFDFGMPFARIEYRYSEYGTFSDTELETSRHQAMVTAGLRF